LSIQAKRIDQMVVIHRYGYKSYGTVPENAFDTSTLKAVDVGTQKLTTIKLRSTIILYKIKKTFPRTS
jgi:hypothetical protein